VTGGTVFWLNDTVDGGPVAAQEHVFIPAGWDAETLWRERLQPLGVELLRNTLRDIAAGRLVRIPQDHGIATWEPALDPPALYRPDLTQLGVLPDGYAVVTEHLYGMDYMPVSM
jgi:methionyl-tRNA formyltransferase